MNPRLYYFHDPTCSWCWGYQSTWQKLKAALPSEIQVINILGGLAADSDAAMEEIIRSFPDIAMNVSDFVTLD